MHMLHYMVSLSSRTEQHNIFDIYIQHCNVSVGSHLCILLNRTKVLKVPNLLVQRFIYN